MSNTLLIGFLDLKNICFDTNIIKIGTFLAILETKMYFMAAILNFQLFGGKKWGDIVVPDSFELSIVQSPILQIFMLLSGCARTKHFLLLIRPTIRFSRLYIKDNKIIKILFTKIARAFIKVSKCAD